MAKTGAMTVPSGISVGINHGHVTTLRTLKPRPASRKGVRPGPFPTRSLVRATGQRARPGDSAEVPRNQPVVSRRLPGAGGDCSGRKRSADRRNPGGLLRVLRESPPQGRKGHIEEAHCGGSDNRPRAALRPDPSGPWRRSGFAWPAGREGSTGRPHLADQTLLHAPRSTVPVRAGARPSLKRRWSVREAFSAVALSWTVRRWCRPGCTRRMRAGGR
jgi:hypothetical protein